MGLIFLDFSSRFIDLVIYGYRASPYVDAFAPLGLIRLEYGDLNKVRILELSSISISCFSGIANPKNCKPLQKWY